MPKPLMQVTLPRTAAFMAALAALPMQGETPGGAPGPAPMDCYTQVVVVTFKSEALARQARLQVAPLYHDLRAAFSTRMDDSNLNDLVVADVMGRFGQKGTFYLNDPKSWYQDSAETGIRMPANPAGVIPGRLLAGGNSIGGHTLTHEMLPALSKNAAFREIMGVRVALETRAATPVNSFVYPFVHPQSALRDGTDRADLEEMLRRSGYYQLAEDRYNAGWDSGFQDGTFIILDNRSVGGRSTEEILSEARGADERPLFLVTMHAWVSSWGAPGFPRLAAIYDKWSHRDDWWYCNQNQYAAYRYQARHSRLAAFVSGSTLRAVLRRPSPLDLNDWTPLSFRVDGVGRDDVVSVACDGADAKVFPLGESYAFDLFHDRNLGPVEAYAQTGPGGGPPQESPGGTEGLQALLERTTGGLALRLHNAGPKPLHDIRVVFRLPLRWADGVIRREVGSLEGGSSITLDAPLSERADAAGYADGAEYDVAQVDFAGARRARLYAVCESEALEPAPAFARGGFWILGPLPGDKANFDPGVFSLPFMKGGAPEASYAVPWVGSISWKALPPAKAMFLDPDIIPTSGKANTPENYPWDSSVFFPHKNVHYLLYGRIVSARDQVVWAVFRRESMKSLSLNGRLVEGDQLELRKGVNDVRILYAPSPGTGSTYDEGNYGCYFRLAGGGARPEGVRFERPPKP